MTENSKARLRFAWRAVEALLALGLLAILAELVLVLVNSPSPMPEIRFIRREVQPEAAPEVAVNNPPGKMQAAPEIAMPAKAKAPGVAALPEKGRVKANNPPARPVTPPLLDFTNLRRVIGLTPARNPSPVNEDTKAAQIVVINPIVVPGTNSLPNGGGGTNTPAATNTTGSTIQTNDTKTLGMSTNAAGPTYRLSIP